MKKPLARRTDVDRSQQLRLASQLAFLVLNLWIGAQFFLWVRFVETGGASAAATRPPGVEGWLPIAGLMNLKALAVTGSIPRVHAAAMFLLIAFLTISLLLKKAFCSWLCPIGTISEWLWRPLHISIRVPKWLDIPLRSLKYLLFAFFAWAVLWMTAADIARFMASPYGLIADVKMLDFFRFIGETGLAVIGVLVALSIVIENFWCRYLCPYGALLGLTALLSPTRIRRDANACIDCAKCAKVCPSRLPVDTLPQVRSAECMLCMRCTAVCPVKTALEVKMAKRRLPAWAVATAIASIFFGIVLFARITHHWNSRVPPGIYRALISNASNVSHPMPALQ